MNDLEEALRETDLIMIIADHEEYKKLNPDNIGKSALYDGRGIIMENKFRGLNHAMIGNLG